MWIKYPTIEDVPTKYGSVTLAFTNAGHVHVQTEGHVNDTKPVLTYRGLEYLASVHLYAATDWCEGSERYGFYITRRSPTERTASPTARLAIVDALTDTVRAYVADHPEVLRQAAYADANNEFERVQTLRDELLKEQAELATQLEALAKVMADNAPKEGE